MPPVTMIGPRAERRIFDQSESWFLSLLDRESCAVIEDQQPPRRTVMGHALGQLITLDAAFADLIPDPVAGIAEPSIGAVGLVIGEGASRPFNDGGAIKQGREGSSLGEVNPGRLVRTIAEGALRLRPQRHR